MRTNFSKSDLFGDAYNYSIYLQALDLIGIGKLGTTASGIETYNYYGSVMPGTIVPSLITNDMLFSFKTQITRIGYKKALIFTRELPEYDVINFSTDIGIKIITAHYVEDKLIEKQELNKETLDEFRKNNQNVPIFDKTEKFVELVKKVESAITNYNKGKSLENLAYHFIDSLGLIPENNVRTPSGQIDILVRNNKKGAFWVELGDPILVECKNTKNPAGARDLKAFNTQLGNLKTGLFISWKGISDPDDFGNGKKVVHDAWVKGKRIIILQDFDFKEIISGVFPELVLSKKYNAQWIEYEG